jgi:hypothetical protein
MAYDFYCYVQNGVIERYNIAKPKAHGNTAFGENATDVELVQHGYFPIVGETPAYDSSTERLEGPVYAVGDGVVTRTYTVVPIPHSDIIAPVWEKIKAERDRRKAGGVKVVINGTDKWFHSDDASRIQQIGLVMMGANIPADLQWKTMDGTFVTMTQTLANQVFAASAASDQAIFSKAEWHKAQMEASANPATYHFEQDADKTRWPLIYGE